MSFKQHRKIFLKHRVSDKLGGRITISKEALWKDKKNTVVINGLSKFKNSKTGPWECTAETVKKSLDFRLRIC